VAAAIYIDESLLLPIGTKQIKPNGEAVLCLHDG
jgi:hypothetical protein